MQLVDALSEAVGGRAGLESGIAPAVLAARGMRVMRVMVEEYRRSGWANRWTPEEEQFLREQIGLMSDAEIGAALGRSAFAIKIHRQRKGIPAHSRRPGWLTGNGAAKLMGVDVHNVMRLCRRGLLPHQVMPGERGILMGREAGRDRGEGEAVGQLVGAALGGDQAGSPFLAGEGQQCNGGVERGDGCFHGAGAGGWDIVQRGGPDEAEKEFR